MDHARYIGRIGALAVTLGVGWAVATAAPAAAHADTVGASSASGDASTSTRTTAGSSERGASSNAAGRREARKARRAQAGADSSDSSGSTPKRERRATSPRVTEAHRSDADTDTTGPPRTDRPLVRIVTNLVSSAAKSRPDRDPVAPVRGTTLLAALGAVRDEMERTARQRSVNVLSSQVVSPLAADDSPNVLVIGVDGTNLSKILADPANTNFFSVMQGGTTAAASIVGHTTLSNPSWTSVLTGVWGERTGVINNVFTPWTYNRFPTVFNQLETLNPDIQTTTIADWNVIAGIADAGSVGADDVLYIPQVSGDTNWALTDNAVGTATAAAIAAASSDVPNFVFSYFVGVDENGHMYGGDSPEYAAAVSNVDQNLGAILAQVNAWESATGEQWTIIMVTDHGHRPEKGIGHGFQTPRETSTFVIANNPEVFSVGAVNQQYSIVDVTPTVMTLFGASPAAGSDGVSLTTLGDDDVFPANNGAALRAALQDAIATNSSPDAATTLRLDLRTIASSVPYFIDLYGTEATSALQDIADQHIAVISTLAALAIVPVTRFVDASYISTNLVAQIVARLTGVTGARIFPLQRPKQPYTDAPDATIDVAGDRERAAIAV